ncbi:choice-of-anchor G family protein [Mycetocola sp. 2940]|uniref:choice-of-anchor G family protein n=1 Tax=Mycetocola sp. 2940 TaxID=3156452 RepID=UPI003390F049
MTPHSLRRLRPRTRRRSALTSAAAIAAVVATSFSATPTLASWFEEEWVAAPVGVVDCDSANGVLQSQAEGRLLSGQLASLDLDTLATLGGVQVHNSPTAMTVTPTNAQPALPTPDAHANPLNVAALSTVTVELGGVSHLLGDIVEIVTTPGSPSTEVSALGQYARASTNGLATGAAGFVSDMGAIEAYDVGSVPGLARLDLSTLVQALAGSAVSGALADVTDVSLEVGAVGANATLDACGVAFGGVSDETLQREYLITSLDTVITSPSVASLVGDLETYLSDVETAVNGLTTDAGVVTTLENGVTGILNTSLAGGLRLGTVDATVSATIDLAPVRTFLSLPFADADGLLLIDPGTGTLRVDTASLLGSAYASDRSHLNGLPPNTPLLLTDAVVDALTAALDAAIVSWLGQAQALLTDALDAVHVSVGISADIAVSVGVILPQVVPIGSLDATATGTLGSLNTTAEFSVLPGLEEVILLGPVLDSILNGPIADQLDLLVTGLSTGLGAVVESTVRGAVPTADGMVPTGQASAPIASMLGAVMALYVDGVVSLTANAQNDPLTGSPEPADWASVPDDEYRVAALRIGVLDALGQSAGGIYLAKGSVGPGCPVLAC